MVASFLISFFLYIAVNAFNSRPNEIFAKYPIHHALYCSRFTLHDIIVTNVNIKII